MKLDDFYEADQKDDKVTKRILSNKLAMDLTNFVADFGLNGSKMQVVTKIPPTESPVKFGFGIILVKMSPDPKQKKALVVCEVGINILKLIEKETVNRIIIRPRLKSTTHLESNFLDRYVEFIQGHLNIFGDHVKVVKK